MGTLTRIIAGTLLPLLAVGFSGPASAAVDEADIKAAKSAAKDLLKAKTFEDRDGCMTVLMALAKEDANVKPIIKDALIEIFESGNKKLRSRGVQRSFEKLLAARRELDAMRAETLALIRDLERYPYPYEPPLAPPGDVARFKESQAAIDEAVKAMRALVRTTKPVPLPKAVKRGLSLGVWARQASKRASKRVALVLDLPVPENLPPWMYGLPLPGEVPDDEVTLTSFAMSLVEAEALSRNRLIEDYNRTLAEDLQRAADSEFQKERVAAEFEQVQRTNQYRRLFGLHSLAWDRRLHAACSQHAEYIERTGDFGHTQPIAEMATFAQRAKLAGYREIVYENCHLGAVTPFDALAALSKSSAHHRTILHPEVYEMATARAGLVWVQNYGLDTGFRSAIQWSPWRD